LLLWNNKKLQKLELKNCMINSYGCECIGEGLSKNTTLRHLDISNNKFNPSSLKKWAEILGRTALRYLDLSNNDLSDEGSLSIV
jgi:Leucine-rich repeat (LRR) protein